MVDIDKIPKPNRGPSWATDALRELLSHVALISPNTTEEPTLDTEDTSSPDFSELIPSQNSLAE